MRIKNVDLTQPNIEIIPIIRQGKDVIIKAQCVRDLDEFEKMCPTPEPPFITYRGQTKAVPNPEDPKFKKDMNEYATRRTNWLVLKSLAATPDLEWDTVNMADPDTWGNYRQELTAANFSQAEQIRIINGVMNANGLDDERVEESKNRFLSTQQDPAKQPSRPEDQLST